MYESQYNLGLIHFIDSSPTPFHTVRQMGNILETAGYARLFERDPWKLKTGGRYYVCRNDSSIIAFVMGKKDVLETGIRMTGSHTDSPCLKIKPRPVVAKQSCLQFGVEVYGGPLLNTWFDRDLSIAGRIHYLTSGGQIKNTLIDFTVPVAVIPSLAIHLDRKANENKSVNAQNELYPVILNLEEDEKVSFRSLLLDLMGKQGSACDVLSVLDYELSLYDVQPPSLVGLKNDFITGSRLDNLISCYTSLMGLLEAGEDNTCLLVCNDHEEAGSLSASGAKGPFLETVLKRLYPEPESLARIIDMSMMLSVDNAHGIHPNYKSKYDENHGPELNMGPVIKSNANQRYASNSETSAVFRYLCEEAKIPVQDFVVRNDMPCGSTIGPLTAGRIGIKTLDIGVPMLAMHSIRETAGIKDAFYLYIVLKDYFRSDCLI